MFTHNQREFPDVPKVQIWKVEHPGKTSKRGKALASNNVTIDLIESAEEDIYGKLAELFTKCLKK